MASPLVRLTLAAVLTVTGAGGAQAAAVPPVAELERWLGELQRHAEPCRAERLGALAGAVIGSVIGGNVAHDRPAAGAAGGAALGALFGKLIVRQGSAGGRECEAPVPAPVRPPTRLERA